MAKLLIIDGYSLAFRAYYAYPPSLTLADGFIKAGRGQEEDVEIIKGSGSKSITFNIKNLIKTQKE